eukprot:COSAG04_NODE_2459_length_4086_cov_14.393780_3_plen_70_part_00
MRGEGGAEARVGVAWRVPVLSMVLCSVCGSGAEHTGVEPTKGKSKGGGGRGIRVRMACANPTMGDARYM